MSSFFAPGTPRAASLPRRSSTSWEKAASGDSAPKASPHPYTLDLLNGLGLPTKHLRSKSWDEFASPGAPRMDFVFTVCDDAAGEVCPVWPGQPMTARWGVPDPAAVLGP